MSKYINADELKLILNREHLNYSQMIEKKFVLNAIDKMPSADVVEVVRCKDCKYLFLGDEGRLKVCCRNYPSDWRGVYSVDDFCNYGERKETDDRPNQTND